MANNPEVWTEMAGPLKTFVRRRVRDEHAADDLVQDVLLKAQANIAGAPEGERLSAWLFQIARNTVIDYYRSARRRERSPEDGVVELATEEGEEDLTTDLTGCLRPMVEKLPEPYREALKLADQQGMTQQAIADRLGISLPGAKSRVQRARRMLREMMVDCCAVKTDRNGQIIDHRRTDRAGQYCGDEPGTCGDPNRE